MPIVLAYAEPPVAMAAPIGPITDPQWEPLAVPFQEIPKYYPQDALEHGIDGEAIVGCLVDNRGSLSDCKVLREAPEGRGFGASAVVLAAEFRMKPTTLSGVPVAGRRVNFPIRFRLPWSEIDARDERAVYAVIGRTIYIRKPTGQDMARVYPQAAANRNVEGFGTIHCRVTPEGAMGGCVVVAEGPPGEHFGDAALRLAPLFGIDITKAAGLVAVGKEFSIPIRFRLPRG